MTRHCARHGDRPTDRHSERPFFGGVNLGGHAKRREDKARDQTARQGKAPHRTTPHQKPQPRLAFASCRPVSDARAPRRMMTFGISS